MNISFLKDLEVAREEDTEAFNIVVVNIIAMDQIEEDVKVIRSRLPKICSDYDVVAAYLYGSFASGEQHPKSDVDIAIYLGDHSLKKLLEISRRVQEEIDIERRFDVIALNEADARFQFRVIQNGTVLYESSPSERADIEVKIDRKYHDIKHHLEEHWKERRKRVMEDG